METTGGLGVPLGEQSATTEILESHRTRDCNGVSQRRSSNTIEAKDHEVVLEVSFHSRQNPVPKISQHKLLETHLTCSLRGFANTKKEFLVSNLEVFR